MWPVQYNGILLSLKGKAILTCATTWMILKHKANGNKPDANRVIPLCEGPGVVKLRDRKYQGLEGVGRGSSCLMGFQLRMPTKSWRWTVVMVTQQSMYLIPLTHTLKKG